MQNEQTMFSNHLLEGGCILLKNLKRQLSVSPELLRTQQMNWVCANYGGACAIRIVDR